LHKEARTDYGNCESDKKEGIKEEISISNVIEFASCFNSYVYIMDRMSYMMSCKTIFNDIKIEDEIFFYFSGHGSKNMTPGKYGLVIPTGKKKSEFLCRNDLAKLIEENLPNIINITFIIDSCHSGEIVPLPYIMENKKYKYRDNDKISSTEHTIHDGKRILVFSSSTGKEASGFYDRKNEYGSLFTHYLMEILERDEYINFNNLLSNIQTNVTEYRISRKKKTQTINIQSNDIDILKKGIYPFV